MDGKDCFATFNALKIVFMKKIKNFLVIAFAAIVALVLPFFLAIGITDTYRMIGVKTTYTYYPWGKNKFLILFGLLMLFVLDYLAAGFILIKGSPERFNKISSHIPYIILTFLWCLFIVFSLHFVD